MKVRIAQSNFALGELSPHLAARSDIMERTGSISSIISGGRWVRSDRRYIDDE